MTQTCHFDAVIYKNTSLNDLPNEKWRIIPNTNNRYSASNLGRIKSHKRTCNLAIGNKGWRVVKERIRKQHLTKRGYLRVSLSDNNNKQRTYACHRLIALAWIENHNNKPTVNHINGVKHDNRIENLEWATHKEQTIHAENNNLVTHPRGENHANSKLKEKDIIKIRAMCEYYNYTEIARMYCVDPALIRRICLRKIWRHI